MLKQALCAAVAVAALNLGYASASAQTVFPPPGAPEAAQEAPGAASLDQLVSPVALYPDDLLAQVLAASTYPLEVVQAHRWISQPDNATLTNGALLSAVADQGWDPSVQALVPLPQVLALMDDHLDWTEQLGEAFLAQPQAVMDAVQRLRHRAEAAGTLKITPDQSVVNEGGDISVASDGGQNVYVPSYDPQCVYGAWPYPAAGPVDFGPWTGACDASDDDVDYDNGTYLPYGFFLWADVDWLHHRLRIDPTRYALAQPGREQFGDQWQHDPAHRRGAGYRNAWNERRFGPSLHAAPQYHYYAGFSGDRPAVRMAVQRGPQLQPAGERPAMRVGAPMAAHAEASHSGAMGGFHR